MDDGVPRRPAGRFEWEKALRGDPHAKPDPVPGLVVELSETTGRARGRLLVLLVLGTFMNEDGGDAWPGLPALAATTGYAVIQVRRHLEWADDVGLLEQVKRGGRRGDGTRRATEWQAALPLIQTSDAGSPLPLIQTSDAGGPQPLISLPQPLISATSTAHPDEQPPLISTTHPHHSDEDDAMHSIPTDSTDAAEQRERADEPTLVDRVLAARPPGASVLGWTEPRVLAARAEAIASGVPEHRVDEVLVALAGDSAVASPAAVRHLDSLRRARARAAGASREAPALPAWCGRCDPAGEHNASRRWREDEAGAPYRCPDCHPGRAA